MVTASGLGVVAVGIVGSDSVPRSGAAAALPAPRIMVREERDPEIARRATALVTLLEASTLCSSGDAR